MISKLITVSKLAGFCPGVRSADEKIRKLIGDRSENEKIYTLGNLIHNRIYNEKLSLMGVQSVSIDELENRIIENEGAHVSVLIRTHGITKTDEQYLRHLAEKYANFTFYDATCPFVKRIHRIADENTNDGTVFLLYSDPSHPEAKGIMSYAKGASYSAPDALCIVKFQTTSAKRSLCAFVACQGGSGLQDRTSGGLHCKT